MNFAFLKGTVVKEDASQSLKSKIPLKIWKTVKL